MALVHVGTRHDDFRAHRLQVKDLLLTHLVRNDQHEPIALLTRDERQPEAGVARRGFDERAARLDAPGLLRRFEQIETDAILDGTAGILVFELEEEPTRACIEAARREQRGAPDHLERVLENG
jgi:hypothetical protein